MTTIADLIAGPERALIQEVTLVDEILTNRAGGSHSSNHGNGTDDLLAAIESMEDTIRTWKAALS